MKLPGLDAKLPISVTCEHLNGRVAAPVAGTRVEAVRKSSSTGDTFVADVRSDGTFAMCLPRAHYSVAVRGAMLSFPIKVELADTAVGLDLHGFALRDVEQPLPAIANVPSEINGVVADIVARDPQIIGLGEATHGTAELTTMRTALTFELIRRTRTQLVMFENDAIAAMALDDYVNGANIDLPKAVAGLEFWTTDTYEFLKFFEDLRAYNATAHDKVHVWGIDVQNTELPVNLLLAHASELKLTEAEQALVKLVAEESGKRVADLARPQRAQLDAILTRLSTPRSNALDDLRIAVAARSLAVQVGYFDGDKAGLYGLRRDVGMAGLARFIAEQTGAARACLWAHAAHVARETRGGDTSLGGELATALGKRYYPVGFYIYAGSTRAWDAAGEIGVISHPIPRAADYMAEGAVMNATGARDVAWLPLARLPTDLTRWLATPRYVREVGALYVATDLLALRDIPAAFDALVVIRSGHDSSPTPSGARKAK